MVDGMMSKQIASRHAALIPVAEGLSLEEKRRTRLLEVAERSFSQDGYNAVTMDVIARAAGVSKKTLYKSFSSKGELFAAIIFEYQRNFHIPVPTEGSSDLEGLQEILLKMTNFILDGHAVDIVRAIITEFNDRPGLGCVFHRQATRSACLGLETYLASLAKNGRYAIDDPAEAAKMLLGMIINDFHTRMLLGISKQPSAALIKRQIVEAATIFLRGVRALNGCEADRISTS
ncbi:MAG: TetR/AcrR family transcriptional regulator [Acidobacteriaceae bacterium]|nr:TetR/AcrR family transcriptional regulator [Acidobacteriaceae bacterium]